MQMVIWTKKAQEGDRRGICKCEVMPKIREKLYNHFMSQHEKNT